MGQAYREVVVDVEEETLSREEAKDLLDAEKAARDKLRKSYGTSPASTSKVPSQTKTQRKGTAAGSETYYTTEVSPTDLVPNPDEKVTEQTPDFYRNGSQRVVETTDPITGEVSRNVEWFPVPELIADRSGPMLSSIRLIKTNSVPRKDNRKDPGERLIPEFSKFFLTSVQEGHQEKFQTVETFNDWYAFFYGEKPPIYNFSGYLLNLANYNWWNEFIYYYENFWRGTKAVELGAKIYLTYNYQQVQGYILNVNTNLQAATDKAAPFSISMLVTKRKIFNGIKGDNILRDNLLPVQGLFDTNASATPFVQQLAANYLKGAIPAKNNEQIKDSNLGAADKAIKNSSQSAQTQNTASVSQDTVNTNKPQGESWASNITKGLGSFLGF